MKPRDTSLYLVYGLRLASDRPISGLNSVESSQGDRADVSVQFEAEETESAADFAGETVWYVGDIVDHNGNPALKIWKHQQSGEYRMRYSHGLTFYLDARLTVIRVRCAVPMENDDVADFLLGPVLGVLLRLRGVICLHASVVGIQDKAIAFVGPPGAGKSTTAGLFSRRGHSVLSDDIAALFEREDSYYVLSAYPYLNLWPEMAALLTGPKVGSLPETSTAGMDKAKLRVPLDECNLRFQREGLPLAAIYVLAERSGESRAPFAMPLAPSEALMNLVANTYGNKTLDVSTRAQEFRVLGELTNVLPIRRVVANEDPSRLDRLYEIICEDFACTCTGAFQG
ncbi:MAG TPA: hypothetical protein VGU63_16410 [Candidatus Acidoferrales bacterium]|nr:hypothetical protein [Candidatus Acidoferrales bacterium]